MLLAFFINKTKIYISLYSKDNKQKWFCFIICEINKREKILSTTKRTEIFNRCNKNYYKKNENEMIDSARWNLQKFMIKINLKRSRKKTNWTQKQNNFFLNHTYLQIYIYIHINTITIHIVIIKCNLYNIYNRLINDLRWPWQDDKNKKWWQAANLSLPIPRYHAIS